MKHVGTNSYNRVIHEVNKTLHNLARMIYPWLANIPPLWPDMIAFLEGYKPYVVTKRVSWHSPYEGWFKCNTDGASKGNPGQSSYGFCVRNCKGDLIFSKEKTIEETTNMVPEAKTIAVGLTFYQ